MLLQLTYPTLLYCKVGFSRGPLGVVGFLFMFPVLMVNAAEAQSGGMWLS